MGKRFRNKVPGYIGEVVYRLDANANEYCMAVIFRDKATYEANAENPETDRWFRQLRELLEADPEWHDGEIVYSAGVAAS